MESELLVVNQIESILEVLKHQEEFRHINFDKVSVSEISNRLTSYQQSTTTLIKATRSYLRSLNISCESNISSVAYSDSNYIYTTTSAVSNYQFSIAVPLFNHRDKLSNVNEFCDALEEAYELDDVTRERTKINILRQKVDQGTRRLLPPVNIDEIMKVINANLKKCF